MLTPEARVEAVVRDLPFEVSEPVRAAMVRLVVDIEVEHALEAFMAALRDDARAYQRGLSRRSERDLGLSHG